MGTDITTILQATPQHLVLQTQLLNPKPETEIFYSSREIDNAGHPIK